MRGGFVVDVVSTIVSTPKPDHTATPLAGQDLCLPQDRLSAVSVANLTSWFAEEVQPHESSLRSYLRSVFPSLPDIDDLVQESYARLLRAK